jgi:hypothetical protein
MADIYALQNELNQAEAGTRAFLAVPNDPDAVYQTFRVTLDGTDYSCALDYSTREECFLLSVYDANDQPIALDLKCVVLKPMLVYLRSRPVPIGEFVVQDLSGNPATPKLGELGPGRRCELTYYSQEPEIL